jgi:outer membrane biosynthesis protein TonB
MRVGFVFSSLAHAAIILSAAATLPSMFDETDDFQMVPVEIIEIGTETNVRAAALKLAEEPAPVKEKEPRFAEAPPPPPAMNEPVASEDAMPALTKSKDRKPEPQKKAEKARSKKNMPRRKPRPPSAQSKEEFDLGELQALLDKAPKDEPKPRAQHSDDPLDSLDDFLAEDQGDLPRRGIGEGTALTISEIDALRQEMQKCWRPPTGAANPEELVVELRIWLNEDGSLLRAPRILRSGTSAFGKNSFTIAAEEAARRAVVMCAPYDFLPINKYDRWKEVTITFDPASMIGY